MSIDTAGTSASPLRNAMVDRLVKWRSLRTPQVEAAMRAVPRHRFVPDVPVENAYADDGVITHPGADGRARSMASAPSIMALMLEQLDVQPGHRTAEIGAGTGYNAALLAHLAGPDGQVTTIDIDDDIVEAARGALTATGYGTVQVVCGDGEYGWPGRAPYDRVIVTAGAWDVPPAWMEQLAPGGLIVVPLRVAGLTRSVAFQRQDGFLRSRSMGYCGFIPMRGAGHCPEPTLTLREGVQLRLDDHKDADPQALAQALDHPAHHRWLAVAVSEEELGHFEFWLASLDGFCRLLARPTAARDGLVEPMYRWGSMAVFTQDTLAYLTMRKAEPGRGERSIYELGVCAYGPQADDLAERVAEEIHHWDREGRSLTDLWIEVHPADTATHLDGHLVTDKRHTRVAVKTAPTAG